MKININKTNFRALIRTSLKSYFNLSLILLVMLIILSTVEIFYNGFSHEFPPKLINVLAWSYFLDIIFWLKCFPIVFLAFLLLYTIKPNIAKIAYIIFSCFLILTQLSLIKYFNTSLLPLGSDLYGYSIKDIKQTIGASGGVSIFYILLVLFIITFSIILFIKFAIKFKISIGISFLVLIISTSLLCLGFISGIRTQIFESDYANNLALNKTDYFFANSYDYFYQREAELDIYSDNYSGDFGSDNFYKVLAKQYVDEKNYPFFKSDSTQDVLAAFLNKSNKQPNIVILLVEGLGRAFTNDGAYLGNFTPFIDSLSSQSLYWKNFLSEGGRTFAVLSSILGSTPFAKNGFLEMGRKMPPNLTLLNILKSNGYQTSFYYGGDSEFDNMKMYLKDNNVDEINDEKTFPSGYQKLPQTNGFTWGYNDNSLFKYYLNSRKLNDKPQLSVLLTVSTHDPFRINDQEKYFKKFEDRLNILGFDESTKSTYRNYKYQYASILYTDDALKEFFNQYKRRSDFANTIFIITGDHRMPEIPMSNKIDRYHVPFIIYSLLLKRNSQFASISTHFDVTPTMLAYLSKNYQVKVPKYNSWMGDGIDTSRQFRNIHDYPLIQTKTDLLDFIQDTYHLNGKSLFKLNADMGETLVEDQQMYNRINSAFDKFKAKNNLIIKGSKLWPDSMINKFNP